MDHDSQVRGMVYEIIRSMQNFNVMLVALLRRPGGFGVFRSELIRIFPHLSISERMRAWKCMDDGVWSVQKTNMCILRMNNKNVLDSVFVRIPCFVIILEILYTL